MSDPTSNATILTFLGILVPGTDVCICAKHGYRNTIAYIEFPCLALLCIFVSGNDVRGQCMHEWHSCMCGRQSWADAVEFNNYY